MSNGRWKDDDSDAGSGQRHPRRARRSRPTASAAWSRCRCWRTRRVVAASVLMPADWRRAVPPEVAPMMISLGGAAGPNAGGMTPMAGRAGAGESPSPNAEAGRCAAGGEAPEMVEPTPDAEARADPPKPVDKAVRPSRRRRKPTTGPRSRPAIGARRHRRRADSVRRAADAAAAAPAACSSTSATSAAPSTSTQMNQRIRQNWNQQAGRGGTAIVKFTIRRDGMLTNVEVEKTSGKALLDLESRARRPEDHAAAAAAARVHRELADRSPDLRLSALMTFTIPLCPPPLPSPGAVRDRLAAQQPPAPPPPQPPAAAATSG